MKKSFKEKENEYNKLWYANPAKKEEALKMVEQCVKDYPENLYVINQDLASLYSELNLHEKANQVLNEALDRGIWYPKEFFQSVWDLKEYGQTVSRWSEISSQAKENSKPKYEVILPTEYNPNKTYPLFIALHGWGEDIPMFREFWNSNQIKKEYILVYIQSSQMVGSFHYCWTHNKQSHEEIEETMSEIFSKYLINYEQIIVGGFSEGAALSMDIALNHTYLPVKGFIALNPNKPNIFTTENILRSKQRGMSGSIITGDQDQCYNEQIEMVSMFDENGFNCFFTVKENFGHWFPENLSEKLDDSLEYINKQ
ncbi:alpha/beta hydrolase [Chengkuizengella marina]|nr:hypothetical protein [Chengkuizengella marina]